MWRHIPSHAFPTFATARRPTREIFATPPQIFSPWPRTEGSRLAKERRGAWSEQGLLEANPVWWSAYEPA